MLGLGLVSRKENEIKEKKYTHKGNSKRLGLGMIHATIVGCKTAFSPFAGKKERKNGKRLRE
jgi:hypothetical protein